MEAFVVSYPFLATRPTAASLKANNVVMMSSGPESSNTTSRRSFLFTGLATISAALLATQATPARADGSAVRNRARAMYGSRVLALGPVISVLPILVDKEEWILVNTAVREPTMGDPEPGLLVAERPAMKLYISGVFGENRPIMRQLLQQEAVVYEKAKMLEQAALQRDKGAAKSAANELLAAFDEFVKMGNVKENPWAGTPGQEWSSDYGYMRRPGKLPYVNDDVNSPFAKAALDSQA